MIFLDRASVAAALPFPTLIAALEMGFAQADVVAPLRAAHVLAERSTGADVLLLMPGWRPDGYLGVKLVTVMPAASPSLHSTYLLMSARTGDGLAVIDGETLTTRRTAAVSALAARRLARPDARRLLMVGAGSLCEDVIRAHATARPLEEIRLWARNEDKARARAKSIVEIPIDVVAADDLEDAVRWADIICCATTSRTPIVKGAWLRSGQHLELIGGFRPDMREVDDAAILRSQIFVDNRIAALAEAGDLTQPIAAGVISASSLRADLGELCRGSDVGRASDTEITLFKSVGTALADLVAATLAYEHGPAI